jgi:signal transduction histidine kinase
MTGFSTFQLVDAAVHFFPALVWAIVAQNGWRFLRTRRPQSRFFHMLPIVGSTVACGYMLFTVVALIPPELRRNPPTGVLLLFVVNEWSNFAIVALARHLVRFFPTPEEPRPGPGWLAVNYGTSVAMDLLALAYVGLIHMPLIPPRSDVYQVLRNTYQLIILALIVWRMFRIARPGVWEPGGGSWVARRADVVFLGGALVSLGSWVILTLTTRRVVPPTLWEPSVAGVVLDAIAGFGFAVPLAVRILGEVVRGFLIVAATLATTATVYFGTQRLSAALAEPAVRSLLDVAAVFVLVVLLVPGQAWLRAAIDHVIFRRSRRRRTELQAFVHTLSPELGAVECCRRALPEVIRVMQLRGAAILLHSGDAVVDGTIAFAPVERLWRGDVAAEAFPQHALIGYELRELPEPLKEALSNTDVVAVVPIRSYRRSWGLLLISTGLLGATFSDEDEQGLHSFADQLALTLDGAELLARTVAIERSLAHAEKLAAIGELAARVAHEIRNPVTAARSLAQQLSREPTSPLNAEHAGLILAELERVERQVAALLRFARREEFQFAPVDVGELARATVERSRPRLEASGVELHLSAPDGLMVRADHEKLQAVLINVIENALDALDETTGSRRLELVVSSTNGAVTVQVADNGPGIPADALPHLFEPFFSLKPHGTGLGLAIAKRTIEAHGGRIAAAPATGSGLSLQIELPLAGRETTR